MVREEVVLHACVAQEGKEAFARETSATVRYYLSWTGKQSLLKRLFERHFWAQDDPH